jgi:hypothetical protein
MKLSMPITVALFCLACAGGVGSAPAVGTIVDGGPSAVTAPMPLLSLAAPAFASGSLGIFSGPDKAKDLSTTGWTTDTMPAWIAYDISAAPVGQRQQALFAIYAIHCPDYVNNTPAAYMQMPLDYTIEANAATGGTSSVPATGWVQLTSVSNNLNSVRQHLLNLNGANWVRLSISRGSAVNVNINLDVYSAPEGGSDSWQFMGDSITHMTFPHAFSDLALLVRAAKPAYYPAVVEAGIGGAATTTAVSIIDANMADFPGRFIVLAYGTNDHPDNFQMEALVKKVLAAGKVPVIPRAPWSDQRLVDGPLVNAQIDALYLKYPQIVRGPDLWAEFFNRTDLIPAGDVHPNAAGQIALRQAWAAAMQKIYR